MGGAVCVGVCMVYIHKLYVSVDGADRLQVSQRVRGCRSMNRGIIMITRDFNISILMAHC